MKTYEATEAAYKDGYEAGVKDGTKNITKAYKSVMWHLTITNSIIMICFVALAIVFHKWWIALFAILFFSYPKNQAVKKYYRICDRCGKHSPYTDSYNDALDKAKAAGWIHHVDGDKDYCPKCKMMF